MSVIYTTICTAGTVLNLPILLIMRLVNQESTTIRAGEGTAWRDGVRYFVPDEIKTIMYIILAIGIVCDILLFVFLLEMRKNINCLQI